ncbi:MAG TPA: hypothetical protein VHA82_15050 [Ramlibacter sp.]|uniref:hypothetical protein n=1 Tax=Ramlibacter sp. TaxID=1917967 RepID=UPI002C16E136|nr:hypothetical protein [Ramlibacter sp.]HVZ45126.1 hypothetical protein [Ramlibacter sp.]
MSPVHAFQQHPAALFSGALLVSLLAAGTFFDTLALARDTRFACERPSSQAVDGAPSAMQARREGRNDS